MPDTTWYHVGSNLIQLNDHADNNNEEQYYIQYTQQRNRWEPNSVQELYNNLQRRADERANNLNPTTQRQHTDTTTTTNKTTNTTTTTNTTKLCFFGHTTTTGKKYKNNPSPWPNIPSSVTLCKRCYLRGRRGQQPPPTAEAPNGGKHLKRHSPSAYDHSNV